MNWGIWLEQKYNKDNASGKERGNLIVNEGSSYILEEQLKFLSEIRHWIHKFKWMLVKIYT
jgi:hypothetical protein